jgi:prepilin-type N-terminal cleavage/methylation domain-containing protein
MFTNRGTRKRRGVTLIEVVVGLAMLGTLLTAMMIMAGRFQRLQKSAIEKTEAVRLLDKQVGSLYRKGFPNADAHWPVESNATWIISTRRRPWSDSPEKFEIVRVSISDKSDLARVLATVELLVAKP